MELIILTWNADQKLPADSLCRAMIEQNPRNHPLTISRLLRLTEAGSTLPLPIWIAQSTATPAAVSMALSTLKSSLIRRPSYLRSH